jgi:DNA-binding MarR family transcriptional regulator
VGTTESQALSYLEVHGSSGQSELARDLGLTSSALTALVDRLERSGVAERIAHVRDRRRSMIRITEHGAVLVRESHRWLDAALNRVAPDDLELVSESLATIADDLSRRRAGYDDPDAEDDPDDDPDSEPEPDADHDAGPDASVEEGDVAGTGHALPA